MAQALPKPEYRRYAACAKYACLFGIDAPDTLVSVGQCDSYACFYLRQIRLFPLTMRQLRLFLFATDTRVYIDNATDTPVPNYAYIWQYG